MKSAIYVGKVRHTRLAPFTHDFEYRVYYGLFDLDELPRLDRKLRLFSTRRANLFRFDSSKHGAAKPVALRANIEDLLAEAGTALDGGRIEVLAFFKVLGYVFDPISVWYCYGPDDELRAVIHEVRNTFGDKHLYVVPIEGDGDMRHRFDKQLHVSPFNAMEQQYSFTMTAPSERLAVGIEVSDEEGLMLRVGLRLSRRPLTDWQLVKVFLTHPLVTLKAISGIHWQAFRLWRKGARYRPVPEPHRPNFTIVDNQEQLT